MMDNAPTGAMTVRGAARRLNVDEKTACRLARLAVCPPAGQGEHAQRAPGLKVAGAWGFKPPDLAGCPDPRKNTAARQAVEGGKT